MSSLSRMRSRKLVNAIRRTKQRKLRREKNNFFNFQKKEG